MIVKENETLSILFIGKESLIKISLMLPRIFRLQEILKYCTIIVYMYTIVVVNAL